jgi:hypothetical protein
LTLYLPDTFPPRHQPSRFVILWHAVPEPITDASGKIRVSHFDFMLEDGDRLVTFELPRIPIPSERIALARLADHRKDYLEFEGRLTADAHGNDRGYVSRWTSGHYQYFRRAREKQILELTSDRVSARVVLKPKPSIEELGAFRQTIESWEMYVSRWNISEKPCSKT